MISVYLLLDFLSIRSMDWWSCPDRVGGYYG